MSNQVARRQGQPILFLGLLLVGWCLVRVLTWQNPWQKVERLTEPMMLAGSGLDARVGEAGFVKASGGPAEMAEMASQAVTERDDPVKTSSLTYPSQITLSARKSVPGTSQPGTLRVGNTLPGELIAANLASASPPPVPINSPGIEEVAAQPSTGERPIPRWRFDNWALLREGGGARFQTGNAPASYGASQVGGVLAYRFAPTSRFRPAAYLRATRALASGGESEGAVGLRARPLAALPLDLHVEARATERTGGIEVRPAAFVAGGIDRADLPAGVRLRGYGQAGYVHGDFATAFADGKLVAERKVIGFATGSASLGTGAWVGAQKGAHRFDLGPTLSLDFKLGKIPARLEADYRFRIAGNAEPGSGGVLTLSTGF